ncbi:MAG: hypothetical protein HXX10_02260 [Rhodoplanes sp.]|uniref:hypothetical protein n=1 Tax=Rhodoplanes sp. TaxID=1968906 RepID=UPI00180627F4|nr:hypothetical protein [Rhodoplanes sp.]NVO12837.1 hypothetical protein [Rhodoplanes sp.]
MQNWIGTAFFAAAAVLLLAGFAHKRRVLAARAAAAARGIVPTEPGLRSVAAFGEIMRPVILFFLAYAGLKTAVLFLVLDGEELLSWFDLAGVLALLAAYGTWMSLRTSYRMSDLAVAEAAAAEAKAGPAAATTAVAKTPSYVGRPANDPGPPDGGIPRRRGAR